MTCLRSSSSFSLAERPTRMVHPRDFERQAGMGSPMSRAARRGARGSALGQGARDQEGFALALEIGELESELLERGLGVPDLRFEALEPRFGLSVALVKPARVVNDRYAGIHGDANPTARVEILAFEVLALVAQVLIGHEDVPELAQALVRRGIRRPWRTAPRCAPRATGTSCRSARGRSRGASRGKALRLFANRMPRSSALKLPSSRAGRGSRTRAPRRPFAEARSPTRSSSIAQRSPDISPLLGLRARASTTRPSSSTRTMLPAPLQRRA